MNAAQQRLARDPNLKAVVDEAEGILNAARGQGLGRRTFLKLAGLAGGGLTLAFHLGSPSLAQGQEAAGGTTLNAF